MRACFCCAFLLVLSFASQLLVLFSSAQNPKGGKRPAKPEPSRRAQPESPAQPSSVQPPPNTVRREWPPGVVFGFVLSPSTRNKRNMLFHSRFRVGARRWSGNRHQKHQTQNLNNPRSLHVLVLVIRQRVQAMKVAIRIYQLNC